MFLFFKWRKCVLIFTYFQFFLPLHRIILSEAIFKKHRKKLAFWWCRKHWIQSIICKEKSNFAFSACVYIMHLHDQMRDELMSRHFRCPCQKKTAKTKKNNKLLPLWSFIANFWYVFLLPVGFHMAVQRTCVVVCKEKSKFGYFFNSSQEHLIFLGAGQCS